MGAKRHNAMFRRKEWAGTMLIDGAPFAALGSRAKEANDAAGEAPASRYGGDWEEDR
jgi:hypothetical protein